MAIASISNNYFSHVDLKLFFWFSLGVLANLPFIERTQESEAQPLEPNSQLVGSGGRRW